MACSRLALSIHLGRYMSCASEVGAAEPLPVVPSKVDGASPTATTRSATFSVPTDHNDLAVLISRLSCTRVRVRVGVRVEAR